MTFKTKAFSVLLAATVALTTGSLTIAAPASAATLTEITNFGTNPSNLRMHLYLPDQLAPRPAVLLAVHYCTGTGPAFYSGTEFASLADQHGFIVIYPSANRDGNCFDVSSPQALQHDGGSDPVGLVSMVRYVLERHNGDPDRVFVTGLSSGAMMTNVLIGDYPDVFSAGAAFAGVPFACFATTDGSMWNSACAQGQIIRSPQAWGNLVRGAFPGYSGPRPRMQLWHGTADDTLRYPNFGEEIKQWTDVHGLSQTPAFTDSPRPGWTRTRYGGTGGTAPVEAVSIQNGPHNILMAGMAAEAIRFFGLDSTTPTPPATTSPPVGGTDCRVTSSVSAWNTGLVADLTITNTGSAAINGWSLAFGLPGGQTITSGWGANYSPASGQVTAQNAGYNATVGPNQSVTIGFQATHTGDSAAAAAFVLNGTPCATR